MDEDPWHKVTYRKHVQQLPWETRQYPTIKHEWDGFSETGEQLWYIQFSNGNRITNRDPKYFSLLKRHNIQ